jgi:hypothetical protein
MKRIVLLPILIASLSAVLVAQSSQQGSIVRMRMTDCMPTEHGFMTMMSGGAVQASTGMLCPEYVMVTRNVVYAISGKTSDELLPLAEATNFRLQKNEMLIHVDDSGKESHFRIKAMITRAEWDRSQSAPATQMAQAHSLDTTALRDQQ